MFEERFALGLKSRIAGCFSRRWSLYILGTECISGSSCIRPKNLEYRISNKEPQNYEGSTSTFDIPCSIFCGSESTYKTDSYHYYGVMWG